MALSNKQKVRILQSKVKQTLKGLRSGERATVKQVLSNLRRTQEEISVILKNSTRFQMPFFRLLMSDINGKIASFQSDMQNSVVATQGTAFQMGEDLTEDILKSTVTLYPGSPKLSTEIIGTAQVFTADLVTKMSNEMSRDISRTLRQSLLRGETPFQAARKIDGIIGITKKKGYMNRSDVIARTEINRGFSIARQEKDEQTAEVVPGLKKRWITAQDERVRPSGTYPHQSKERWNHRNANNQVREVNEPFIVSGEDLMFPRDPNGSAGNVINCRCQSVPFMEEWE